MLLDEQPLGAQVQQRFSHGGDADTEVDRQLVEAHGGSIALESEPGRGTAKARGAREPETA